MKFEKTLCKIECENTGCKTFQRKNMDCETLNQSEIGA